MPPDIEKRFKNISKSVTFNNILDINNLRTRSVFDIGCSYGEFLKHFGKGSVGLTIVEEESDYNNETGLDVRVGNIESEDIPVTEKFDVVFANNILEHLYSPHGFLVKIKDYLNEDGEIIIGVPCIPKIVWLWNITKFRGSLAVGHINFFTRQSLQKTIERAGYIVIANRSFHSKNKFIDWCLNLISPHQYVVAKPDAKFEYHEKRLKELSGYKNVIK